MFIDNNIQPFSIDKNIQFNKGLNFNNQNSVENFIKTDPFSKFFNEAVNLYESTNTIQKDVEQKQIDFITGKSDDMIALSMAQSRASSAIQFTSQVTNKILTAYQEIMRISV